jgi:hypothetical protein
MCVPNESSRVEVITAKPGTEEYDCQFQRQSSSAIKLIVKMPLVRTVCGVLSVLYIAIVVLSTVFVIQSQLRDGVNFLGLIAHAFSLLVMWWLISVQGRIALYGDFTKRSKAASV